MTREEMLAALTLERFGPAPLPRAVPKARVSSTEDPQVVDDAAETAAEVLRMAGYHWSTTQIAAVLDLPETTVARIMRDGRKAA